MLQTRQKVFPIVPKCPKMSTSDASLSERTCCCSFFCGPGSGPQGCCGGCRSIDNGSVYEWWWWRQCWWMMSVLMNDDVGVDEWWQCWWMMTVLMHDDGRGWWWNWRHLTKTNSSNDILTLRSVKQLRSVENISFLYKGTDESRVVRQTSVHQVVLVHLTRFHHLLVRGGRMGKKLNQGRAIFLSILLSPTHAFNPPP